MLAPSTIDERFGRGTTEPETARLAEFALPIPEANFVRRRIRVRGVVQGVGYRPFVFRLAAEEQLAGWVTNDSEGVVAEVEGDPEHIERLVARLNKEWPLLARVDAVESAAIKGADATGAARERGFQIRPSEQGAEARTGIPADAATCPDCLRELLDANDRR